MIKTGTQKQLRKGNVVKRGRLKRWHSKMLKESHRNAYKDNGKVQRNEARVVQGEVLVVGKNTGVVVCCTWVS